MPLSASTVLQVFELLPSQPLPRGIPLNDAKSFSLGAYSHGVVGVQTATRTRPQAAAVFCQAVKAVAPDHPFSTITVHKQVNVSCHRDSQNFDVPNLVVPLTFFTGGALFVYDDQGNSEHDGCKGMWRINLGSSMLKSIDMRSFLMRVFGSRWWLTVSIDCICFPLPTKPTS